MSDGLRYLRKVIDEDDRTGLFQVSEADFLDSELANEVAAYEYIVQHSTEHDTLPSVSAVRAETEVRLPEAPDALSYYLDKLIQRKIYNEAREINHDFRADMAHKNVGNLYTIGRRFMDIANDPRVVNTSMQDHAGMAESVNRAKQKMRDCSPAIPTGWGSIDDMMMGGLRSSDLVYLIARTNTGKTQALLNSAKAAYTVGNKILIISMEMVMDDMTLLFMAHMAGINPKYINPYFLGYYEQRRMDIVQEQIRDEDRVFIHKGGSGMTPNKVRWLIESLQPNIVYIDSTYLMAPDGANTSRLDRYSKVALVTDQILEIIVECGVPIYNTSQFNRQAGRGGTDGSLENIGYSDTISTHSSLIISMKGVFIGDNADNSKNEVDRSKRELEVIKSRKGAVAPFNINFNFAPIDFSEVDYTVQEEDYEDHLIAELEGE